MKKFDIYLARLDPIIGDEVAKTRPAVIISQNSMNNALSNIIILPMTTTIRDWKTRITIDFNGNYSQIMLDQIRAISKQRLIKKLGSIEDEDIRQKIINTIIEMVE